MENKTVIKKVLVGSRLHETNRDDSDYDYRGIHISPLIDFLSPFKKLKNTSWLEGDIDDTSYELSEFCKLATQGNATIWEVFKSDKIEGSSAISDEMDLNWYKFMDAGKFLSASRGYANNQYRKALDYSDEGIKNQPRTAKFIISFLRVMWQAEQFFKTGEFFCSLKDSDQYDFIMQIKGLTKSEMEPLLPEALGRMNEFEKRLIKAHAESEYKDMKPDIEWIEDFIYRSYLAVNLAQESPKEGGLIMDRDIQWYLDAYEAKLISQKELSDALKRQSK